MTRRSLLLGGIGSGLAGAVAPGTPLPATRPAWVKAEGLVMVGNWEPLTFLQRRGGATLDELANWEAQRSEATARKLQEAGVNLVVTNFFKGFGLMTEAADIAATRRFVGYAHKHGIRVGGYIGGSMMFETFFAEEPDAADWKQLDELGRPIGYLNPAQGFRYMACRNHPGYHAFLLMLMRIGVEDLKLDLIHFDQLESWTEPAVCRCRYCQQNFRAFLRDKYTDALLLQRFGFARLDGILPPPFGPFVAAGRAEIANPLMQDWVEFRAASYAKRYREYDAYLRTLNPDVALEGNPNVDASIPKGASNGVDLGRLLQHGDIVWSEEPQEASWTPDGRLVSKIRSFKITRRMGKSLFVYTGGSIHNSSADSPSHLKLAEAMAYNEMNLGMVGDVIPEGVSLSLQASRYIRFFHDHKAIFSGAQPVAELALLRSFASIEFNPVRSLVSSVLFEQSLIQSRIPFDIILDRHLADLSRYRVLVLADQDALGDSQLLAVRNFVAGGGGLVATGDTSLLTDWRLRRSKFGLADLFGRDMPTALTEPATPVERAYGRGRVVYIPRIEPSVEPPATKADYRFDNAYWKLPRNHDDLIGAVAWASRGDFPVSVDAPRSVTIELTRQAATGRLLLHLVNYDFRHPVAGIEVALRLPLGVTLDEIRLESPDFPGTQSLKGVVRNGRVSFRVPRLDVYDLVVAAFRRE